MKGHVIRNSVTIFITGFLFIAVALQVSHAQNKGPVIIPRPLEESSPHEGSANISHPGFREDVSSELGATPAVTHQLAPDFLHAAGSRFKALVLDPAISGFRERLEQPLYSFSRKTEWLYGGFRDIGGVYRSDIAQLGEPGRGWPGDPQWVSFPNPGTISIPSTYSSTFHTFDCFCQWDELVACPTGSPPPLGIPILVDGPNIHSAWGGTADFISCQACFGTWNIRKHGSNADSLNHGHYGYPSSPDLSEDLGYQACRNQNWVSYSLPDYGMFPVQSHQYGL